MKLARWGSRISAAGTPSRFYSGKDLRFLNQQVAHSMEHGRNRYEFYVPKADGSKVPVIISSRSIQTPDGRRLGVVTFTDISAQKQAEEKLRQANQELAKRQREIEADLALASQVQRSLVPQAMRWGRLSIIDTAYLPVRTIGGDFGLVIPRDEEIIRAVSAVLRPESGRSVDRVGGPGHCRYGDFQ